MTQEELASLLELDAAELQRAGEQALPHDDAAHGYAVQSLERIADELDQQGDVADVLPGHGGVVQHLQWALGTYFVAPANDRERIDVVQGRSLRLDSGELLVSGRDAPAVVRLLVAGAPRAVYVLGHGRAEAWSLARSEPTTESVAFMVPELPNLTGGEPGPEDLEREFEGLRASPAPLDRLAAPGLLLRFWVPRDRAARRKLLAAMALAESPLLARVRHWYQAVPDATRATATSLALSEVDALRDELSNLQTEPASAREHATRIALARDRLESIRRVLGCAGQPDSLQRALDALDDFAGTHLTQLAGAGVSDERLSRVLSSEPDAWWARINH